MYTYTFKVRFKKVVRSKRNPLSHLKTCYRRPVVRAASLSEAIEVVERQYLNRYDFVVYDWTSDSPED